MYQQPPRAALPGFLGQKKGLMTLLTMAGTVIGHKFGLPLEILGLLTGSGGAYVFGQGMADNGKEAMKAWQAAPTEGNPPTGVMPSPPPIANAPRQGSARFGALLLPIAMFAVFALCCSCAVLKGEEGLPFTVNAGATTLTGEAIVDIRTDGESFLAFGEAAGYFVIRDKSSGVPLWGPFTTDANLIYLYSRARDVKLKFEPGQKLPAWVRDEAHLFAPGEAEAMGIEFMPDPFE